MHVHAVSTESLIQFGCQIRDAPKSMIHALNPRELHAAQHCPMLKDQSA
jgi:hypothetical protein